MANKIICRFCGAEFDEMLPRCPYCDSTNYKGAEAEYLNKLEDVREDMDDLRQVPVEETKKSFLKNGKFVIIVFAVVAVLLIALGIFTYWMEHQYERDEKADYLWKQENYPKLDQLYEEAKYDELMMLFSSEEYENAPVWDWEHYLFCETYSTAVYLKDHLEREAAGKELSELDLGLVLSYEWDLMGLSYSDLTEEEQAYFADYVKMAEEDFNSRWNMSEEDYNFFYQQLEDYGWVSYIDCRDYVEKWYKNR